ncbi:MAG: hypothetical protein HN350_07735 [Phycisphaerales bacterium]|nr:hypothetical protein [Phycisphaerales bacterium]
MTTSKLTIRCDEPDGILLLRWFAIYATLIAMAGLWLWMLLAAQTGVSFDSLGQFQDSLPAMPRTIKLLTFAIYASLACTFIPLPVNVVVAAVATRAVAVGSGLWDTVLIVGLIGAIASTLANLNDYHIFTWMLRLRKVAKVRNTRIYNMAVRWFNKSPFFLVTLFNVLPLPVDVVRILAATHRYPRVSFAAANFIGRFIRYCFIAYLVYYFELSIQTATLIMLALAVIMLALKILPGLVGSKNASNAS